jgi:signal transduction histidine kinase
VHPLLSRQLRKLGLADGKAPTAEQWQLFLERLEQTYAATDQDRYMNERSLEVCSREMQDLYDQLRSASEAEIAKKSAERELSLSIARAIQDSVDEGIVACDGDRLLSWNRRFVEMWKVPDSVLATSMLSALEAHVRSLTKTSDVLTADTSELVDIELTDGRTFVRYSSLFSVVEGVSCGRVFSFRDVTAKRRDAAQRAVVAERMTSVGQLVASVAHEINNPLSYVRGNIEFVSAELRRLAAEGHPELVEVLNDSREGVDRIAVIVRDLRALSRVDDETRARVDVVAAMESALQMAHNEIRHRARVVRKLEPAPFVMANEGRLVQLFLNLLVNAAHAIPEGRASQNEITVSMGTTDAGAARVAIRDTGSGIAEASLERIFDPFFTTKAIGTGTGLGLSICKGIVEKLGGRIAVESVVAQGTTFVIELPRAQVESETAPPSHAAAGPVGPLRVLVVDDEPMMRRMLVRLMRDHQVVTVSTVDEGLELLGKERFDLVLCDLMMPDRTGADMHAELQRRWPAMLARFVVMSGGAFTPALQSFLEQPSIARLDKPLSLDGIRDVIRRVAALERPA